MKVQISIVKQIEIDVESEALERLDHLYRTTLYENWKDIDYNLVEQACLDVEKATGLRFASYANPDGEEVVIGVYAMDGEAIIEG